MDREREREKVTWTDRQTDRQTTVRERDFWIRQIHRQRKNTDRPRERGHMLGNSLKSSDYYMARAPEP